MKVLLLFLMGFSLYANDIVTEYRLHGTQGIEKKLDFELTKKSYWYNYIRNIDTKFGYSEKYSNILVCNKEKSTLCVYKKNENKKYALKKVYSAFTGKLKGDKEKEGDFKTPNGVYNLVKKLNHVDSFYGPLAFVTSYPNLYDKYEGRDGHGIWIHGVPVGKKRDAFTKGCIAIKNKSIECLSKNIDINKTVLIINPNKTVFNVSKKTISSVLAQLYMWRYAWIYNDLETYLSFYAPEFRRFDGKNYENFKRYKTRIFNKRENKTIIFTNLSVIPYSNKLNTYEITFNEKYHSNSFLFKGKKTLIIEMKNNKMKILTEQ